jgi:polygalacturonase
MKLIKIVTSGILVIGIIAIIIIGKHLGNTDGITGITEKDAYSDTASSNPIPQEDHERKLRIRGTTSQRPSEIPKGFVYFDTTLNRTIYWNGTLWVENLNFNIKDLGAKGDGVTNDTKAIQRALDLAQENPKITFYFPEGVYNTGRLRLHKNTSINLHTNAVIKRIGQTTKLFVNGELGNSDYATGYNGEGNIHFKGGTIDLNAFDAPLSNDKGTTAFDLGHAKNISFRNLTIKNGQNGHYFQIASSRNVLFDGCWFGDVLITNASSNNYELIQIEEARKISFPTFGSYDGTISRDVTIKNCYFENVIRAIGTHSYSRGRDGVTPLRYNENIRVVNNVFINSVSHFGHFEAFKNVVIENNVFENYGEDPIYFNESIHYIVRNNHFSNSMNNNS